MYTRRFHEEIRKWTLKRVPKFSQTDIKIVQVEISNGVAVGGGCKQGEFGYFSEFINFWGMLFLEMGGKSFQKMEVSPPPPPPPHNYLRESTQTNILKEWFHKLLVQNHKIVGYKD